MHEAELVRAKLLATRARVDRVVDHIQRNPAYVLSTPRLSPIRGATWGSGCHGAPPRSVTPNLALDIPTPAPRRFRSATSNPCGTTLEGSQSPAGRNPSSTGGAFQGAPPASRLYPPGPNGGTTHLLPKDSPVRSSESLPPMEDVIGVLDGLTLRSGSLNSGGARLKEPRSTCGLLSPWLHVAVTRIYVYFVFGWW